MKPPKKARLGTAEHIFLRILRNKYGISFRSVAFIGDDTISVPIDKKLAREDVKTVEKEVNDVISEGFMVKKLRLEKNQVGKDVDMTWVPNGKTVRIVEIGDFDKQACRYPHVDNTSQIGTFKISDIKRKQNTYIFQFDVK